jgi:ATP-dependent DNA helicase RecG
MRGDADYTDRADGTDALPVALAKVTDRIQTDNPITTYRDGLFHYEYRTYPEVALREALLNAFSHADYRLASPVMVKQFKDRLELTNPGGFIAGITPENILHHAPAARNPCLVEALVRLRLVNRSNLGMPRIFTAFLAEGKEPPGITSLGEVVRLTMRASELSPAFSIFVQEQEQAGLDLPVDQLLVLQHLLRHPEADTRAIASICQRTEADGRELMAQMERNRGWVERGGTGRSTYWTLAADLHQRLATPGHPDRDRRMDWEAAKTRVLSVLMRRTRNGQAGLSNSELRQVTHLDREQVKRLMAQLRADDQVEMTGTRRGSVWVAKMRRGETS